MENSSSPINEAVHELKNGNMIILVNEGDVGELVCLADKITPNIVNFMVTQGRGLVCQPISEEVAEKLELNLMEKENDASEHANFTVSVDHIDVTTGISAFERATTIERLISSKSKPSDFQRPGHLFPLIAKPDGVFDLRGHTEGAIDLATICNATLSTVNCKILDYGGSVANLSTLIDFSKKHNLKMISIADIITYRVNHEKIVKKTTELTIMTEFGEFDIATYTNKLDDTVAIVLTKGIGEGQTPVVVHSCESVDDLLFSLRYECNLQLNHSLNSIQKLGSGIILSLGLQSSESNYNQKMEKLLIKKSIDIEDNNLININHYLIKTQILDDLGVKRKNNLNVKNRGKQKNSQEIHSLVLGVASRIFSGVRHYAKSKRNAK